MGWQALSQEKKNLISRAGSRGIIAGVTEKPNFKRKIGDVWTDRWGQGWAVMMSTEGQGPLFSNLGHWLSERSSWRATVDTPHNKARDFGCRCVCGRETHVPALRIHGLRWPQWVPPQHVPAQPVQPQPRRPVRGGPGIQPCPAAPLLRRAALHRQAGGRRHGLPLRAQVCAPGPGHPELPGGREHGGENRRLRPVQEHLLGGLLQSQWKWRHPHPLDAPRVHLLQPLHHRVGRVGLRRGAVGDLLVRPAALLRHGARGGHLLRARRPHPRLPRGLPPGAVQPDAPVLEQAARRQAQLPQHSPHPAANVREGGGDGEHLRADACPGQRCLARYDTVGAPGIAAPVPSWEARLADSGSMRSLCPGQNRACAELTRETDACPVHPAEATWSLVCGEAHLLGPWVSWWQA